MDRHTAAALHKLLSLTEEARELAGQLVLLRAQIEGLKQEVADLRQSLKQTDTL